MKADERYIDWIESDVNQYAGEYVYFEFKASEVKRQENLSIRFTDKKPSVIYHDKNQPAEVKDLSLGGNEFALQFKGLSGKGKFMKHLPPPNAKGNIDFGILVGKKFFSRVDEIE